MSIEGPSEIERRKENIHQGVDRLRTKLDVMLNTLDLVDDVQEMFIIEQGVDAANRDLSNIDNEIGGYKSRRKLGLS